MYIYFTMCCISSMSPESSITSISSWFRFCSRRNLYSWSILLLAFSTRPSCFAKCFLSTAKLSDAARVKCLVCFSKLHSFLWLPWIYCCSYEATLIISSSLLV